MAVSDLLSVPKTTAKQQETVKKQQTQQETNKSETAILKHGQAPTHQFSKAKKQAKSKQTQRRTVH